MCAGVHSARLQDAPPSAKVSVSIKSITLIDGPHGNWPYEFKVMCRQPWVGVVCDFILKVAAYSYGKEDMRHFWIAVKLPFHPSLALLLFLQQKNCILERLTHTHTHKDVTLTIHYHNGILYQCVMLCKQPPLWKPLKCLEYISSLGQASLQYSHCVIQWYSV